MKQAIILILLAVAGVATATEKAPKLRRLISTKLNDKQIEKIFSFYREHIPGVMTFIEQQLPDDMDVDAIAAGNAPEEMEEVLEQIKELYVFFEHCSELSREEPEEAKRLIQIRKAEFTAHQLGRQITQAREKNADTSALEKQLREELARIFTMKLEAQKRELKWMERELRELKQIVKKKEKYRDQVIETRFLQLTGDEEVLEF